MSDQKMTLKVLPTGHIDAMCKAMEDTKAFVIERTPDTVTATHARMGEVFRALKADTGLWLIRHVADLFV